MRYSQSTEIALESLFYMAAHGDANDFSVEQLAQAQNISASYLAKVLQQLVKAGLLRSHRGARGGYALSRAPAAISVRDIAVVFEGSSPLYACNATAKHCAAGPRCILLATFKEAERKMHEVLEQVSLQDVVDRTAASAGWVGTGSANAESHLGVRDGVRVR